MMSIYRSEREEKLLEELISKFKEVTGIEIFPNFSSEFLIEDQQISTSEITSSPSDCRSYKSKLLFFKNEEDVSVFVTIEGSINSIDWVEIKKDIEIPPGKNYFGVIYDPHPYIRIKAKTTTPPTTGKFNTIIAKYSI